MIVSPASTDTLPELAWSIRDRAKLAVADEESGRNGVLSALRAMARRTGHRISSLVWQLRQPTPRC